MAIQAEGTSAFMSSLARGAEAPNKGAAVAAPSAELINARKRILWLSWTLHIMPVLDPAAGVRPGNAIYDFMVDAIIKLREP